ncbi:MAG: YqaE/Pmp3 family membrane protein [Ginsengibacter sp.]
MKKIILLVVAIITLAGIDLKSFGAFIVPASNTNQSSGVPESRTVSTALSEFVHLSRKERKLRIKEVKSEVKKYKSEKKSGSEPSTNTLLFVILAILLPPLAVYLHEGEINNKFWLDLILTLLFFIPGVVYALIVVLGKS